MDVSQTKNADTTPFAWDPTYKGEQKEDFARLLNEHEEEAAPVRETRSEARDDDYREDDNIQADSSDDIDREEPAENPEEAIRSDINDQAAVPVAVVPKNGTTQATNQTTTSADDTGTTQQIQTASAKDVAKDIKAGTAETTAAQAGVKADNTTNTEAPSKTAAAPTDTKQAVKATEQPSAATQQAAQAAVATTTKPVSASKETAVTGKSETTGTSQTQVAQNTSSSASQVSVETNKQSTQPGAIETLRAEELAKLSEKDALTTKIGEMLNMSKGKISVPKTASGNGSTNNGSLLSTQTVASANAMSSQATTGTATAIDTVTQAAQQAETPISMQQQGNMPAPVVAAGSTDPSVAGNSSIQGAAIPGVEASSSSSNSQAANSAKAAAQAGTPAEQVSKQITSAVREGADKIKIQLNPAELGRVDIKLEIGQDGRLLAVIAADNQDSLDLLQQDSKTLEKALQDAGFETSDDSLSFSLNQQDQQETMASTSSDASRGVAAEEANETEAVEPGLINARSAEGGLDIAV